MNNRPYFVTGIGTGVGKTVFSSILASALDADYWKPVQAGDLEHSDSNFIKRYSELNAGVIHPEAYSLKYAMSPHKAAELEKVKIDIDQINLPKTENNLIIEGAGGCMVPINWEHTYMDLMAKFNPKIFVVVKNYLGSINHTLLTLEILKAANLDIEGMIIMGAESKGSEEAYLNFGKVPIVHRIPWAKPISPKFVKDQSEILREQLVAV